MKVIQAFHTVCIELYTGYSGPVIGSSTTGTMPLTTQILRTATQWRATPQMINRNLKKNSIPSRIRIVHFVCLFYVPSQQLWSRRDGQFT